MGNGGTRRSVIAELAQPLADHSHRGDGRRVLQGKSRACKVVNALRNEANPVCLWHVSVNAAAKRKEILDVQGVSLASLLVQLLLCAVGAGRGRAGSVAQLRGEVGPVSGGDPTVRTGTTKRREASRGRPTCWRR